MSRFSKGPANPCISTMIRGYELPKKGKQVAQVERGWKSSAACEKGTVMRGKVFTAIQP